jgi:EAL domain-containing protein (putative c-di-GMP-specific phosphodiesterase class I)
VETEDHARILEGLGCDGLQGYAFCKPMSPQDLMAFVAARRWRVAS